MSHFMLFSLLAACCTIVGAIPSLLIRNLSHRSKDVLLAYTAGIMVAASTYGLIPSALRLSNLLTLSIGIMLGTLLLTIMEKVIPHTDPAHAIAPDEQPQVHGLMVLAMLLHNIPEGLSTGISLASKDTQLGSIVSLAMGLQNVPEGFLIALFLATQRTTSLAIVYRVTLIAAVEWGSSAIGFMFGTQLGFLVPYGLAFAAGAMLYVVYKELIPESHGDGHETSATFAFITGTLSMIALTHLME